MQLCKTVEGKGGGPSTLNVVTIGNRDTLELHLSVQFHGGEWSHQDCEPPTDRSLPLVTDLLC